MAKGKIKFNEYYNGREAHYDTYETGEIKDIDQLCFVVLNLQERVEKLERKIKDNFKE